MDDIKASALKQVNIRRSKLKSKLQKLRNKAKREEDEYLQQIQNVRASIANDLAEAYKKGNMDTCREALKSSNDQTAYCKMTFPKSYDDYTDCKDGENFCEYCCEHEFGDVYVGEKQKCIDELCKVKRNTDSGNQRWVWEKPVSDNKPENEKQKEQLINQLSTNNLS